MLKETVAAIKLNNIVIIFFTIKRKKAGLREPGLPNTKLSFAEEVIYSGVSIGSKPTWNSHIKSVHFL